MLFNSFQFLLFFVLVWLLFLVTRGKTRKIILLIASYYFYMCWSTRYIWVIWGITLIDYVAGLQIEKADLPAMKRFCGPGFIDYGSGEDKPDGFAAPAAHAGVFGRLNRRGIALTNGIQFRAKLCGNGGLRLFAFAELFRGHL